MTGKFKWTTEIPPAAEWFDLDRGEKMDKWEWEKTTEHCPRCHAMLLFADDPESDTWTPTGVYKCEKCDFRGEQQYVEGMDGGDLDDSDDYDDDD